MITFLGFLDDILVGLNAGLALVNFVNGHPYIAALNLGVSVFLISGKIGRKS